MYCLAFCQVIYYNKMMMMMRTQLVYRKRGIMTKNIRLEESCRLPIAKFLVYKQTVIVGTTLSWLTQLNIYFCALCLCTVLFAINFRL